MKTITLHNLDKSLDSIIRKRAKEENLSLNRTIQKIIKNNFGIKKETNREDFNKFLGKWNEHDYKEFKSKILDFEKIDKSDWK